MSYRPARSGGNSNFALWAFAISPAHDRVAHSILFAWRSLRTYWWFVLIRSRGSVPKLANICLARLRRGGPVAPVLGRCPTVEELSYSILITAACGRTRR